MPGVIVPRKTINELKRLLDDAADMVEIAVSTQKIRFALGEAVLTSKLIDGSFPEYARVIPKGNSKTLEDRQQGVPRSGGPRRDGVGGAFALGAAGDRDG